MTIPAITPTATAATTAIARSGRWTDHVHGGKTRPRTVLGSVDDALGAGIVGGACVIKLSLVPEYQHACPQLHCVANTSNKDSNSRSSQTSAL